MTLSLEPKVWWANLAFFVGIPVLLSLPVGVFRAGYAQFLPLQVSILFWAATWLLTWWTSELLLRILHRVLMPWRTPVFAEIVFAVVVAVALSSLYFPALMQLASQFAVAPPSLGEDPPGFRWSSAYMLELFVSGAPGMIAWVILRSLFAMLPASFGPRMEAPAKEVLQGTGPETEATRSVTVPTRPVPRFLRELYEAGIKDISQVVAIQANDHYVSVLLREGRELLILSRFSDAVDAMASDEGIRIHRSYWVRRDAIEHVERDGAQLLARLLTGHEFPVSAKYRGLLEHVVNQG